MSAFPTIVGITAACLAIIASGWLSTPGPAASQQSTPAPSTPKPTAPKPPATPATSGAQAPAAGAGGAAQPAAPAGGGAATSTEPTPASGSKPPERSAIDDTVKLIKASQDFLVGLVGTVQWPVVALILLLLSRNRLLPSLQSLLATIQERGGTVDATILKVQVGEALETFADRTTFFSRSSLDIEDDEAREGASLIGDLTPQLDFPIGDSLAKAWAKHDDGTREAARGMASAREALTQRCQTATTLAEVRTELVAFARALEKTRFLKAEALFDLLRQRPFVQTGIDGLQPGALPAAQEDCLIVHCAAVAHGYAASQGRTDADWKTAKALHDKIVWKGTIAHYLPAADTWLACAYSECLEASKNLDINSLGVISAIGGLLEKGAAAYQAMQGADWTVFGSSAANTVYYKRELLKVRGSLAATLGEVSRDRVQKDNYFQQATNALEECARDIDGQPAAPLDHNNLADLYVQLGDYHQAPDWYVKAHAELDRAFLNNPDPDPIFYNTRAFIHWRQQAPLKGLLALQEYGEDRARRAGLEDLAQYVDNQVFAARLGTAVDARHEVSGLSLAATILEPVRRLLDDKRAGGAADARSIDELQVKVEAVLAEVYLRLPGREIQAMEAYERLLAIGGGTAGSEVLWRRHVGLAAALTRLGRLERQRFSSDVAARFRTRAVAELASATTAVEAFGLDPAKFANLQVSRHFRLRLDTVLALQRLAQESFLQGATKESRDLLEQAGKMLLSLRAALDPQGAPPQPLDRAVAGELLRAEARRCFLLARLRIQADPEFTDAGLIEKVEADLRAASSDDEDLNCRINLQLGDFLLTAALAGRGDGVALADRALASLERATARNAPALRAVAIRALGDAYQRRTAVLRKVREAAKSAKAK